MCVCQGMRNTKTDREPKRREEGRGPAPCERPVRHPDPVSAQPKAISPCPNEAVWCQTTAPHHGHCAARTVVQADVLSHPALCLGLPHSLAGVTQPLLPNVHHQAGDPIS